MRCFKKSTKISNKNIISQISHAILYLHGFDPVSNAYVKLLKKFSMPLFFCILYGVPELLPKMEEYSLQYDTEPFWFQHNYKWSNPTKTVFGCQILLWRDVPWHPPSWIEPMWFVFFGTYIYKVWPRTFIDVSLE